MQRRSGHWFHVTHARTRGSRLAAESQRAVVIHASQLFDGKSDRLASKQLIVIQGERIAEVGPEAAGGRGYRFSEKGHAPTQKWAARPDPFDRNAL